MQNKKAIIAALTTYVIFGFTFLATRLALEHISADILLAVRFTISFVCMTPVFRRCTMFFPTF